MRAPSRAAAHWAARPQTGGHDSHQTRTRRQAPGRATAGPAMPRGHRSSPQHLGSPGTPAAPRTPGNPPRPGGS